MTTLIQSPKKKIKTTIVLIFICLVAAGQNFSPFNASVTKRFYNSANAADNSYFFYADSVHSPAAGKTTFHQYFTLQQPASTVNVAGCGFWTAGAISVADTTWLGVDILYDSNTQRLVLKNSKGDTLDFDFSTLPGDSSKFFESSTDKYFIKAGQGQIETIYSVTDAVKTFTILHYSTGNQIVNSTLHGKLIKLGQQTGLIRFIDAYNFPAIEKYLELKGQLNPLIGSYQMRFEDLYPFQVGDSLQYLGTSSPCTFARVYRVTARQETSNTVTITFNKSLFNTGFAPLQGCSVPDVYPNTFSFQKNSDILGFPYNRLVDGSYPLTTLGRSGPGFETRTEGLSLSICGSRINYTGKALSAAYCSTCACIGNLDAYALALPTAAYVNGLGVQNLSIATFSMSGGQTNSNLGLVYSSIGGTVCGTYHTLGLAKYELKNISVYPNPISEKLMISAPVDQLIIFSADGIPVRSIFQPPPTIETGDLLPGLYILHLRKGENIVYIRIIKI
jgi:hypothetical protein